MHECIHIQPHGSYHVVQSRKGHGLYSRKLSPTLAGKREQGVEQRRIQGDTYEEIIEQLSKEALTSALQLPGGQQYIIGIAGCPGSGKTTLACEVAKRITALCAEKGFTRTAAVAPMDGFHFYKRQLDQMPDPQEAYARRGAPWTFDAEAFVAAIKKIKQQGKAALPSFDHGVGDPIEDDILIDRDQHAVVLVEGNYLFLDSHPWVQLRDLFDDSWFVDCPLDVAMHRVFKRQTATGLKPEVSQGRIAGNDRPNGVLVDASRGVARVLVPSVVPFAGDSSAAGSAEC